MDTLMKGVATFVVFCVGVAVLIVSVAYVVRKNDAPVPYYRPYYYEPEVPSQKPRPYDSMPTPHYPRPGSQTGDVEAKDKK